MPLGIPIGVRVDIRIDIRVDIFIDIPLNDTRDVMMTSLMSFGKGVAAEWS
ncbi:hypothetical protein [Streptomyces platensis]|uniref:hypothetical protein n=1 Tax=Streptomyces platensis TaxID=58346 RepID=UPI00368462E1